ncbi:phosphoenolpyruvate--protein phosphotransferase [Candidatus Avelusimicrobium gallicola]|uniref:Phosphoenolpyruvate-protein phosphotransferase n=1 Tax=Candidatus Avelusimicrobium gallicola TaxID=2562704 RepID=A0A1Y4DFZ9_9BACT|nr:phosphoenolpyruvate--protein phosphotransferase [Elusimicrobium sp. An273]OUO57572.1 phosphoenolpyruvate--protein phosphotransferase [Elusimicrobium sp. An273]
MKNSNQEHSMLVLKGVAASPGVAIGPAVLLPGESFAVTRQYIEAGEVKAELQKISTAMQKTLAELDACEQKVLSTLGTEYANLMSTHKLILQDPSLKESVAKKIRTEHLSAQAAIFLTLQELAASFDKIEDPFFKERRNDIFDVGKRLVNNLEGDKREFLASITKPSLLVAHNLYPSDTINLQENQVIGFCTDVGGKTSHTALLAQSLNIPAVVGLSTASKDVKSGDTLIIDGENGLLVINPDKYTLANYRKIQKEIKKTEALLKTINHLPVITEDGHAVKLFVNYDPRTDNKENKRLITDGLGLLRTEFLYMNTPHPPTEEEQYQVYLSVAKRFDMRPVTIRLADLGADKLPDFPLDEFDQDANPFMGCRGIRLFLKNPDLMFTQLRAIIRMSCEVPAQVKIMVPMISSVEEVRHVRNAFEQVLKEFEAKGKKPVNRVGLGAMIEVPAAAIALDGMIQLLDFISIGTNDLIQYLVAVDRVNQEVAHMYDPCHPAVGRTINQIIQTAHKRGRKVSICGEIASDSKMLPLLLGLNVDALSVTPRMYLRVKNNIRNLNFENCSDLAQAALLMGSSEEIRNLIEQNDKNEDS